MNIEGLGEKAAERLISLGFIKNVADIYELKKFRSQITELEGWGDKSCDKLLESVEDSKSREFHKLLYALGIRFIGEGAAKILARYFKNMDKLHVATSEELSSVHEIGGKMAESILQFFRNPKEAEIVERLKTAGVLMEVENSPGISENHPFAGKSMVITGELSSMTRSKAQELIERLGGRLASAVSKNTGFVVVGMTPGSKYKKALELGIKTIGEEEFLKLVSENTV